MKFKINHIEYETEETNIKLIEFLKNNKLSFINNNLLKVEIENNEQLQNIKDVIIEDGMSLFKDKKSRKLNFLLLIFFMVAWAGIEPATHGFSVHCSTD